MFQASERISGATLWANLHLLFWLSLFPFVTSWVGKSWLAKPPIACYGVVLFMAAASYWILQTTIIGAGKANAQLARAVGSDIKGKLSPFLYLAGIAAAFFIPLISVALYVAVAGMWLIPDPRIERVMARRARAR